jgi:hypothetical protein
VSKIVFVYVDTIIGAIKTTHSLILIKYVIGIRSSCG